MQAIPSRVESGGWIMSTLNWFTHCPDMPRYLMFGLLLGAFFMGAAWQNGSATKTAVTSVQTQYQGKLAYHVQNEKVIAKTAKTALDACQKNLNAAIANDAAGRDLKGCPPTPPAVKAITAPATK